VRKDGNQAGTLELKKNLVQLGGNEIIPEFDQNILRVVNSEVGAVSRSC